MFIEGVENYVSIDPENKELIIHATIKGLLEKLPDVEFIQIHKSYIVVKNKVDSIEGPTLYIKKHQLPVSRYQRKEVPAKIIKG